MMLQPPQDAAAGPRGGERGQGDSGMMMPCESYCGRRAARVLVAPTVGGAARICRGMCADKA
eukprot:1195036-Prorocentrum_minimum.AAC.5